MVRFHRSLRISRGKAGEANQWSKETAEYLKSKYAQQILALEVFTEIFGNVGTIHWFIDYKDVTAADNLRVQLLSDQAYQDRLRKSTDAGFVIEGSGHDTLMSSL